MGIFSRASDVLGSKLDSILDEAEDPVEAMDYAHEQLKDERQEIKRGITDLVTEKKRLENRRSELESEVESYNQKARAAVKKDREDLARRALEKKQALVEEIDEITTQIDELEATKAELLEKKDELEARIEEFERKRETVKARYEATDKEVEAKDAIAGTGGDAEFDRALDRATEEIETAEARKAAIEELKQEGELSDPLSDKDSLDRELESLGVDDEIDTELEVIKDEVTDDDPHETDDPGEMDEPEDEDDRDDADDDRA